MVLDVATIVRGVELLLQYTKLSEERRTCYLRVLAYGDQILAAQWRGEDYDEAYRLLWANLDRARQSQTVRNEDLDRR